MKITCFMKLSTCCQHVTTLYTTSNTMIKKKQARRKWMLLWSLCSIFTPKFISDAILTDFKVQSIFQFSDGFCGKWFIKLHVSLLHANILHTWEELTSHHQNPFVMNTAALYLHFIHEKQLLLQVRGIKMCSLIFWEETLLCFFSIVQRLFMFSKRLLRNIFYTFDTCENNISCEHLSVVCKEISHHTQSTSHP